VRETEYFEPDFIRKFECCHLVSYNQVDVEQPLVVVVGHITGQCFNMMSKVM
jgi:hypothetical protein